MTKARKIASYVLFPLSMWYGIGVMLRNLMFALGIKRETAPHVTTIGVGNLSTGGTGKTPMTEHLLRLLSDDYATAFLSRGYKRRTKGFVLADGEPDAGRLGDEAAMVAAKFPGVTVAVCEQRLAGIRRLMQGEHRPDVVVLDDVYQHRQVKPTVNILLTEYGRPFFRDRILPFGNLREFRSARHRANIVIVTKCPEKLDPVTKHNILLDLRVRNTQKVFFSYLEYGQPQPLFDPVGADPEGASHVLLLCGIANPRPLVDHVGKNRTVVLRQFPDHHAFTAKEILQVVQDFEAIEGDSKIILTTEKDAARLRAPQQAELLQGLPVYQLPVQVRFHPQHDYDFDTCIRSSVKENITFLHSLHTAMNTFRG